MGYGKCIQNGPTIGVGLQQLGVRRHNPPVGSKPSRVYRERDEATQGMTSSWHIWGPNKGTRNPQALYLSSDREVSFMPHRVGCHLANCVFLLGITWESRAKLPSQDLPREGIIPYLVLWRGTCPWCLLPAHYDPGSTQILTLALWC
jgi:hypothetical protein